ncbi:MAG TPA: NAD-dependent epimerase/dehydratase family protein [Saprospiraceae bacterium]|nr:NAD-dependent epimerase/dehydratase family protein [Saprospiraceae bacterium]HMQ84031.1 NAD-dependent epimerase/dehydratase family protein [Saprospiraceae bacterium]
MNNIAKDIPILVTGGTGFIGAYLLQYLCNQGYTAITALKRPNSPLDLVEHLDSIRWIDGDLLDIPLLEDLMHEAKWVFHCAAIVSFRPQEAKEMIRTNVEGTANIVNTALYGGINKLVHLSSIATLGRIREGETLRESNKWQRSRYNTTYAISKFQAEQEVWRGIAEGLNAAIVNPSTVLGSGFPGRGTSGFFELAAKGFPYYGAGTTGWVDVRDVARFMLLLMESQQAEERYVLNAENLSYKEVLTLMAQEFGQQPPRIKITPLLRELAWRGAWLQSKLSGKKPFITKETARMAGRTFYYDAQKSIDAFNFEYTPIHQCIRETCACLLQNQKPKLLDF